MIRLQIGYPLSTLPNADGFQFRGVAENGDLIPCEVRLNQRGTHFAVDAETGDPVFHLLRGWMQYLPKKVTA